ncbi:hypothetical protein, partial [Micromonospora sp. LOL_024]|uniref:hypothetical protein n=1 Tax=Micromonospora sp. LOL_024 TaxID=3345412 RepID=UPI003A8A03C9
MGAGDPGRLFVGSVQDRLGLPSGSGHDRLAFVPCLGTVVVGLFLGELENLFYPGAQASEAWPVAVPPSWGSDRCSCGRPVACHRGILVAVDQAVPDEIGFRRTDQAERGAEHGNRDARPDSCRTEGRTDCDADTEPDKNGGSLDRLAHNFSSDDPDVGLRFQHGERVNPHRPRQPAPRPFQHHPARPRMVNGLFMS